MEEKVNILIADDEAGIRENLSEALKQEGYEVSTARDGYEAVERVKEQSYNIVITDLMMPGMTGLEMMEVIKEINSEMTIIIITGYASLHTAREAIKKGAYDYIAKPLDMEELNTTLRRAVEKQRLSRENKRLFQELEQSNKELREKVIGLLSLSEAARRVSSLLDLENLFKSTIDMVSDIMKSNRVSLMILDEKSNQLIIRAAKGLDGDVIRNTYLKLGEGVAGWVAREGKPLLNAGLEEDSLFEVDPGRRYQSRTFLSTPMLRQEKAIGVLNVTDPADKRVFAKADLDLASVLANQLTITLDRLQMYSDLEEIQEQLVQTGKLAALGQLAGNVAHEINNPLSSIAGAAQYLLMRSDEEKFSGKAIKYLKTIRQQTERLARITESLLEFSRSSASDLEPVDVNEALRDLLVLIEEEFLLDNVEIIKNLDPELPPMKGDKNQLQQVFLNMAMNAKDAMKEGGKLTIKTLQKDDSLVVEFGDTGCGIAPENFNKLFQPFFTTKKAGEGTGLGLSLSFGIIEKHKGTIEVDSKVGKGTTFTIVLPIAESQSCPSP